MTRISDHDIVRLLARYEALHKQGWRVVRPVYVDWFWRGYSIAIKPPMEADR